MSGKPIRTLVVEDDEEDYLITRKVLKDNRRASFEVKWARSYDAALEELGASYDVCLVDYHLGAENGLDLIERAIANGFHAPMILLTGRGDHEVDVEAMKAGAADYLVKDELTPVLVERVIRHSIERKAAEMALRRSEEQLRQSQKMEAVGSLAGGIAHDFNNLLSIIVGYSELLVSDLQTGDPMRADLKEILGAGLRATALTSRLLAFSRQQVLKPRALDLNDVFIGMEKMLRRLIGADVELTWFAASDLRKVMVDPGQMEQVMMNLAVNARDAMPHGGKLTIETANVSLNESEAADHAGIKAGPHVMLTVTDTGTGMDKATQERMFEPFFTTKEIGKGTGLGLSTVFGIVRQSEGAIWVCSEIGKGSTFRACFPVTNVDDMSSTIAIPDRRSLRGSETILVVEDDEPVRVLSVSILRRYGYKVLEAQSGGDALIACEQYPATIDLLLTDVVLPRISGPQLAARLLAVRPEMKVLYMSGHTESSMLRDIQESEFAFLQKPITPELLTRQVRHALTWPLHTIDRAANESAEVNSGIR